MKQHLILLHGALGSSKHLESLKNSMGDTFQIHLLNFSGHGNEPIDEAFSIELFTKDLVELYKKEAIKSALIFGYSMGGYVALNFAAQHPEMVQKIFTYGTKFDWNPIDAAKETSMLNPDKIEEKVPQFAEKLKALYSDNWKNVVLRTATMMLELGKNPVLTEDVISGIQTKTTIGYGTSDQMVRQDESEKVSNLLKDGEMLYFENWIHPIDRLDSGILAEKIKEKFEEHIINQLN